MASKTFSSIVLLPEHLDDLAAALDAIKGRAKVFPTAGQIIAAAERAEQRLDDAGVAYSNRVGCLYAFREAGPTASSYKYRKTVISFALKRTAKGWFVTSAGSEEVHPKQSKLDRVDLTAKAKEAVLRAALRGFGELPAKAA
ncbi:MULTISPECIES: hypothetical protein [Methylobacteriaceae]|jgi:hypothetical protein|uniref:hypothetical protein n=1 Tax=Methylobacterium sp. B4 TaxID=1938755 RepID=UPI000D769923|nr:hypothetical protein [Methylobacterium sp. B4]PXW60560.1 hypothetical protein BY998_109163 [Methylobacterium sp. B4]